MFRLFRKLRTSIITSGRIKRYLLYTIGEIALVVIGILIALQVNNWNEDRKDKIKEKEFLIEIKETLLLEKENISSIIPYYKSLDSSFYQLLYYTDHPDQYKNDLNLEFSLLSQGRGGRFKDSPIKRLEEKGFESISEISIRNKIYEIYYGIIGRYRISLELASMGGEWSVEEV